MPRFFRRQYTNALRDKQHNVKIQNVKLQNVKIQTVKLQNAKINRSP